MESESGADDLQSFFRRIGRFSEIDISFIFGSLISGGQITSNFVTFKPGKYVSPF